jgi:uncharacterized protein (UPF0212 family)
MFVMQARAFDVGEEEAVQTASPISTIVEIVISFCPWCGQDLMKAYALSLSSLVRDELKLSHTTPPSI